MKRQRTDTATGSVEAFRDAQSIDIPDHIDLDAQARIHWRLITNSKAASMWTPTDLDLVAKLAQCRSDYTNARKAMDAERLECEREFKPYKPSWEEHKYIEDLVKRDAMLTKLLQLHPEATVGKARDQVKKNQAAQSARETIEDADEFLSPPVH